MLLGAEIGTSADSLIDKTIYEAAWGEARQNHSKDLDSNAVVGSPHTRSPFGPLRLSIMFKTCGLDSGVSRLHIHSIRTLWAPRVVRSFTTTLTVCGHQRPGSSPWLVRQDKNRKPNPLRIETNELKRHESKEPTLPSTRASQRKVHPETEAREHLQDRCPESC